MSYSAKNTAFQGPSSTAYQRSSIKERVKCILDDFVEVMNERHMLDHEDALNLQLRADLDDLYQDEDEFTVGQRIIYRAMIDLLRLYKIISPSDHELLVNGYLRKAGGE